MKKVLTVSALSLALLVSAAPAFAASPNNSTIPPTQTEVSTQAIKDSFTKDGLIKRRGLPFFFIFKTLIPHQSFLFERITRCFITSYYF